LGESPPLDPQASLFLALPGTETEHWAEQRNQSPGWVFDLIKFVTSDIRH